MVYDQSTGQLVFYSDVGYVGIGCSVRGTRIGQMPAPCPNLKDECANTADAGRWR